MVHTCVWKDCVDLLPLVMWHVTGDFELRNFEWYDSCPNLFQILMFSRSTYVYKLFSKTSVGIKVTFDPYLV